MNLESLVWYPQVGAYQIGNLGSHQGDPPRKSECCINLQCNMYTRILHMNLFLAQFKGSALQPTPLVPFRLVLSSGNKFEYQQGMLNCDFKKSKSLLHIIR